MGHKEAEELAGLGVAVKEHWLSVKDYGLISVNCGYDFVWTYIMFVLTE